MAKVFISYAHEDGAVARRLREQLEQVGHQVDIDSGFLSAGDTLAASIGDRVRAADFVCPLLSPDSVSSPWVSQEIYETLLMELRTNRVKLLPCRVRDCPDPESIKEPRDYERLCVDFTRDEQSAVNQLLTRLKDPGRPIFVGKTYLVLDISSAGLEIYLTGEDWDWADRPQNRYHQTIDAYLLFGFQKKPGHLFKHFVRCDQSQAQDVRGQVQRGGYQADDGDTDWTGQRRLWFLVPDYPGLDAKNNRWPI